MQLRCSQLPNIIDSHPTGVFTCPGGTTMRLKTIALLAAILSATTVSPLFAQLRKVRFSVSAASIAEVPIRIDNVKGFYRDEGLDV